MSVRLSGRRGTFNEEGVEKETKERRKERKVERGQKEAKKNGGGS